MTPTPQSSLRPTEPSAGPPPSSPPVLDERYEILERIGAGGMGVVYRARHVVLGHEVAIKVLRTTSEHADVQLERLRREARVASSLGNPHIVQVKDFGTAPSGETYVVMELLDGRQLFEVVGDGPLEWRRAAHIAAQVCDALGAAHARDIVHRDLKPENVMLLRHGSDRDFVKVLDFGIAKLMKADKRLTVAGELIGTPEYMSPEQCRGIGLDHRSDVYALGVLLYEMVTGALPFDDDDPMEIVYQQMMTEPARPTALVPELPAGLERVILRCLAKDPTERFADMGAVQAALASVLAGEEVALEEEEEEPEPSAARETMIVAPAPSRSRWGLWAVAGLALFAGALAGAVLSPSQAQREPEPEPEPVAAAPRAPVEPPPVTVPVVEPAPGEATPMEVTLSSDPPGADVFVDGERVGATPWTVAVPTGERTVEAELRAPGHRARRVVVSSRTHDDAVVTLERRPAPRPSQPAPSPVAEVEAAPEPPPAQAPARRTPFMNPWGD